MSKPLGLEESCNIVENVFYSLRGRIDYNRELSYGSKSEFLQLMEIAQPHLQKMIEHFKKENEI